MQDTTSITVTYKSTRLEVWRFYWQQWRRRLWIYWLVPILVAGLALYATNNGQPTRDHYFVAGFAIAASWLFFVMYPQVSFKPKERTLTIDSIGIRTTIGEQAGTRTWREIAAIEDCDETINLIVARTRNAFVIPARAFRSVDERSQFLRLARNWHAAAQSA